MWQACRTVDRRWLSRFCRSQPPASLPRIFFVKDTLDTICERHFGHYLRESSISTLHGKTPALWRLCAAVADGHGALQDACAINYNNKTITSHIKCLQDVRATPSLVPARTAVPCHSAHLWRVHRLGRRGLRHHPELRELLARPGRVATVAVSARRMFLHFECASAHGSSDTAYVPSCTMASELPADSCCSRTSRAKAKLFAGSGFVQNIGWDTWVKDKEGASLPANFG